MQTVVSTRQTTAQTTSPKWGGAAPSRADVVLHEQTVLYHVGIGPDGLVGILRQQLGVVAVLGQAVGVGVCLGGSIHPHVVGTCRPRRAVALCTAYLCEQRLAALHVGIIQIAGGRNGQTAVPHHELVVLLVRHLLFALVVFVVQQILLERALEAHIGCVQYLIDTSLDAFVRAVGIVRMQDAQRRLAVLLDVADDCGILTLCLGPGGSAVEPVTVAAGDVGDVPDGIGTGTVLQRTTRHGVGELLHDALAVVVALGVVVRSTIVGRGGKVVGCLVPHGGIQVDVGSFLAVLLAHVVVADGIEQTGTIDTDGRLQAYLIISRYRIGVEGGGRNGHLRIDEAVLLAVGEGHRETAGHLADILPFYLDLVLVNRSLEGRHGLRLRHTRHL